MEKHITGLTPYCIVCWLALACVTTVYSAGISLGGLSLSIGSGGDKGWQPQPSHGWASAQAPVKGWAPEKPAPSVSISLPKPNIGQLLAIPLKVLKWKLNAFGNQQISFRFTLPRISVKKVEAPAPAPWKSHQPQPWASAPKAWAPPPQPWTPGPPPPWTPAPQGWKTVQQEETWKGQPEDWKSETQGWNAEAPKGWQPPAGWKPPQGWQQENNNVKYKK